MKEVLTNIRKLNQKYADPKSHQYSPELCQ